MSDHLQHECGIAMLRLLKPLEYYKEKYGTPFYGINKMYLMLEKQHNRGQDGAGLASVKFDMQPGERYISRIRSNNSQPIQDIFNQINTRISDILKENPEIRNDTEAQKHLLPYIGNVFLGHVRYGTFGKNSIENVHPFLRQNNWHTIWKNLCSTTTITRSFKSSPCWHNNDQLLIGLSWLWLSSLSRQMLNFLRKRLCIVIET